MKSTVEQIRARFDGEVARFSNLETGQTAFQDSPLCLELLAGAAAATNPGATRILDIGCGAGNYTLKLLETLAPGTKPAVDCTLVDLSGPMLAKAKERVEARTAGKVETLQRDMRALELGEERFEIVMAAATLHHLRTDGEWEAVFARIFRALKRGGSFWVVDLVEHADARIEALMKARYGEYLKGVKGGGAEGEAYRDKVFAYIEEEDTPRPLFYQLDLMRRVGFGTIEVLHKHVCSAAYGGVRP